MANLGAVLVSGQSLRGGDYLTSANGQYSAVMQDDGNFIVYWGRLPDRLIGAVWDSGTSGRGDLAGNLVISLDGKPQWQSGTGGRKGSFYAFLSDQGNLVLLQGSPLTGTGYWSIETDVTTTWVKNEGVYVAVASLGDAHSNGASSGNFDKGTCKTLRQPVRVLPR